MNRLKNNKELDEIDCKILQTLMQDSRTSFSKIARECNTSINKIRNRYSRLKKEGIITGEIMDINPSVLGYKTSANIMLRVTFNNNPDVLSQIQNVSGILTVIHGFGRKNVICFASTHNTDELNTVLEKLRNIRGVVETETNVAVGHQKAIYPQNLQFNKRIK